MEAKESFVRIATTVAEKYDVKLKIDWDNSVIDFQGDLDWRDWDALITELNVLASQMEVKNEQPLSWI